jgi:excisionase family DNA binding protein
MQTMSLPEAELRPAKTTEPAISLMTAKACAARLGISERTLWSLTNRKEIPHIRIGRAIRYDPRDIQVWLDKKKRQALK